MEAPSAPRPGHLVRSFERRRLRIYAVQMLADVASVLSGFILAGWIVQGWLPAPMALLQAQLLLPVYLTIAELLRIQLLRIPRQPEQWRLNARVAGRPDG